LSLDGELKRKNTRVANEVVQVDLYFDDANPCVEQEKTTMTNLDQKTIFITGASAGLGRDTAKLFASKGWKVVASMRDPKKELGSISGIQLMSLDVTDPRQIESVA